MVGDGRFWIWEIRYAVCNVLDGANNVVVAGSGFTDILNEEDYMTVKFSGTTGAVL